MRGKERERTDEDEVLHLRLKSPSSAPHPLHRFEIPHSHHIADYILVAGDNISPELKVVRSFFDGGLQIRRDA